MTTARDLTPRTRKLMSASSPRKRALLKLLETPIKFGKIPEAKREAFIAAETQRRIDAAFEFYGIEPDTPESAKWCALAVYLLGEQFSGCRSLAKQPGGAPKNSRTEIDAVLESFSEHCKTARAGSSNTTRATNFLKARGGSIRVGTETIRSPKSLLNFCRREKKTAS
jgi:hypothetical protein